MSYRRVLRQNGGGAAYSGFSVCRVVSRVRVWRQQWYTPAAQRCHELSSIASSDSLYATTHYLGQGGADRTGDVNVTEGGIGADALQILRDAQATQANLKLGTDTGNRTDEWQAKKSNDSNVNELTDKASKIVMNGVEKLLDSLDDEVQKEAGKFNDTIENQGGVLETVARVGQHSVDDEESSSDEKREDNESKVEKPDIHKEVENLEVPLPNLVQNVTEVMTNVEKTIGQQQNQEHPEHHEIVSNQQQSNMTNAKYGEKKNATVKEKNQEQNGRRHQTEDVARLIDRDDNEYVISHPGKRSQMQFQEDLTLIRDIVIVIVASAVGALVFGLLGQPVILGYLAAGMLVGPGGLHLVHELVQVETLAQFGVIFLLFALGVEFSATKMQGVQAVALGGGCIQIFSAMLLGGLLCSSVPQGIFIGAFLSMSSTAVVVKCMMDANMGGTEHGQILLGTLIFQDCALGLLLAVMPALAAKGSSSWSILTALGRECLLLSGFCGVAWVLAKMCVPRLLFTLMRLSKNSSELYQLGIVGVCLCISLLSQCLGLGLEVGAFVAGLMLSGGTYSEKTLHQVEPVRNIFASLFLASIGMVMHPVFLWQHKDILLASLAVMFFGKTFLIAIVVRAFGYSSSISVSVGIALAQIGEFSFVLLSRAQGLGLVSRKLYLLLMGTSAFSLVLTPFAFKIVVRLVPREKKSQYMSFSLPSHSYGYHLETGDKKQHRASLNDQNLKEKENARLLKDNVNQTGNPDREGKEAEDSRGDKVFPQVTLRRPFSQVFSGQWKEWRDLGELQRLYR